MTCTCIAHSTGGHREHRKDHPSFFIVLALTLNFGFFLDEIDNPAHHNVYELYAALATGREVLLGHLLNEAREREQRLNCLALLLQHGTTLQLLPDDDLPLAPGDRILMCGCPGAVDQMQWALVNTGALRYLQTGEQRPEGTLWRWLAKH